MKTRAENKICSYLVDEENERAKIIAKNKSFYVQMCIGDWRWLWGHLDVQYIYKKNYWIFNIYIYIKENLYNESKELYILLSISKVSLKF